MVAVVLDVVVRLEMKHQNHDENDDEEDALPSPVGIHTPGLSPHWTSDRKLPCSASDFGHDEIRFYLAGLCGARQH
jgi:hypothetical protein